MRTSRRIAWVASTSLVLGCSESGGPEGAPAERPRPVETEEAPEALESTASLLEIDPDTLRDLRFTTAAASRHSHTEAVEGLAEARVDEEAYAEVGSPIAARIVSIRAAPGDVVEGGATLAELQSVELGRARAAVVGARRRYEIASETVDRIRGLAESRIAPRSELLEAQAAHAAAEADLRAAEASLLALGVAIPEVIDGGDLSRFPLAAPLGGTVLDRAAILGQVALPDRFLFRIAHLRQVWLVIQVFERDAARLSLGAPVRARFLALPGREFAGRLEFLGTEVDPVARVVRVRAVLGNEEGLLRPGMTATAWISLDGEGEEVLTVPSSAVQRVEEHWCVFVPRSARAFEVRRVARGRELGVEVEILEGLEPGEEVVVQGAFVLKAQAEKAHGGGEHSHH